MNLLFRLSQNVVGFEDIKKTKDFFKNILPLEDDNHFFHTKKMGDRLKENDTIYFSYNNYIVAKAIYRGIIKTIPERDEKFIHGHKIENIKIINSDLTLKTGIVGTRTTYTTNEVQQEIDRVIKENFIEIYPDDIDDKNFIEGSKKQVTVNAYERNQKARRQCIEHYEAKCYICKFDFEKVYGKNGKGFIHVHHEIPLSEIQDEYQINPIQDLKPVCPNCHSMLHGKIPAYSIEDVKNMIDKKNL